MITRSEQRTDSDFFNAEGSVVLISSYPRRQIRTSEDSKGVSSYVQNLVPHLSALLISEGHRLVILTERSKTEPLAYEENQVLVLRAWKRNTLTCFLQMFWTLWHRLRKPKKILIQFEFNLFGGVATTASLPLFILLLRLCGKRPSLMIHQVVKDLAEIREHIGLRHKPLRFALFRLLFPVFYWCLLRSAAGVAVHEPELEKVLVQICERPISVIPHGCSDAKIRPAYRKARKALRFDNQDIVLLCFGFLAHYKGSDWIVKEIAAHRKEFPETPLRLVLAGGESPNHEGKPYYAEFVNEVMNIAARCAEHIQITGYVPDERVPLFFAAADLVVFPYRTQMAASGPLAIALSFGRPFLLSTALTGSLESEDFSGALTDAGLNVADVTFELSSGLLVSKAMALSRNPSCLEAMRRMALAVAAARNWTRTVRQYLDLVNK